jgi:hypothetical protein
MTDPANKSIPQRIIGALADFFNWVTLTLAEDDVRREVLTQLGLNPDTGAAPAYPPGWADRMAAYRSSTSPDAAAWVAASDDVRVAYETIRGLVQAASAGSDATDAFIEDAVHRIFQLLSLNYLRINFPLVFWFGQAAGFVDESFASQLLPAGAKREIAKQLVAAFSDPIDYFKQTYHELYGVNWPIETADQAAALSSATFAPLATLLAIFQKKIYEDLAKAHPDFTPPELRLLYGWEPVIGAPTPTADAIAARALSFGFANIVLDDSAPVDGSSVELGEELAATLIWVPREHGGPGLFVGLGGAGEVDIPIGGGWLFKLRASSAQAVSLLIRDWTDVDVDGPADFSFGIGYERPPGTLDAPYTVDIGDGARLEFGRLSFSFALTSSGPALRLSAPESALVVAGDRDPVLGRAAGPDKLRIDFALALGFANGRFYIEGGSGLQATLPIGKTLGPLRVQQLHLGITPSTTPGQPDLHLEVSTGIVVKLGPITLTLDRIGFGADVTFWDTPEVGFKMADGIGVAIDAEIVSGGGYLFYDRARGQYAGALELSFQDSITVKAIGILTTRMPDGSAGFSFLAILAVEQLDIELGLGFRLTGLGGLIGLDRSVNSAVLEAGVKNHTLDRIMFPPDPIANAPQIVSTASAVFPPTRGHTIVGPFAQISWGASSIVTIELGLILELPTPGKLTILAKLRALLPHRELPVVKIQIDAVGTIDFSRKRASAHAALVDSKLAGFPLMGEAALLLDWGEPSSLTLAFGGVHPSYERQLPEGFPKLDRLAVPLSRDNPTLRLEAYLAITSNTIQIGGKLELRAGKGKFSIEGLLAIDALFQLHPFAVEFDLKAKIQLKAWGVNLFAVTVEGSLSGPNPWHARGKATFEIWIFDYSVSFDHTFGSGDRPPPLPPIDVRAQLLAALSDPRSWSARQPPPGQGLVTLRPGADEGAVLLHPLGALSVTQRVVPLGVQIDRFGAARPSGAARFTIDQALVAGTPVTTAPLSEQFARAQFFDMSDADKLAIPSFERMPAGVMIGTSEMRHGPAADVDAEYETLIYDPATGTAEPEEPYTLGLDRLHMLAEIGAAAVFAPGRVGTARFRGPDRAVAVAWPRYAVASADSLAPALVDGMSAAGSPSYTIAQQALRAAVAAQPERRGQLLVVAADEMANTPAG